MERALLEGEHQTEMAELEAEQDRINILKSKQMDLIDQATAEREKVTILAAILSSIWSYFLTVNTCLILNYFWQLS